jgi:polysaccharide export outer membrane protein
MIYLQGATDTYAVPQEITQAFELRVQPDDQLAISVASKDVELIRPFNNTTLIGGGNNSVSGTNTVNVSSGVSYFHVDEKGNIEFPIFGTIHVGGLTTVEISKMIQERMRKDQIKDAVVNTKIMSFKVTVLGDVKNPGTQTYQGERLTLMEALGKAGDLNNSALRDQVLVVREENGKRTVYEVDLRNNESVFLSPAYYMQQNDVVYVQPSEIKARQSTTDDKALRMTSIFMSGGSLLLSLASLVIGILGMN